MISQEKVDTRLSEAVVPCSERVCNDVKSDWFPDESSRRTLYFMYHRIAGHAGSYPYTVTVRQFDLHLQLVQGIRNDVGFLQTCFTFDDGHSSAYSEAAEMLARYGRHAMFFVTGGWIDTRPDFLTWSQVRMLVNDGHLIGSHGWSHKLLTQCTDEELHFELRSSKEAIEQKIGVAVNSVSVPGGRWNSRVLRACAAAGYQNVFTSDPGAGRLMHHGIYLYPRVNVTRSMTLEQFHHLIRTRSHSLTRLRIQYRAKHMARSVVGDRIYHNLWCFLHGWHNDEDMPEVA